MFVGGFAPISCCIFKAGSRIFKGGRTPKQLAQPVLRNELFRPILATLAEEIPEDVGEHPGVDRRKAPILQALEFEAGERR